MSVDTVPSAYPRTVEELLPHARDLPKQPVDGLPARNLLMRTFKIGAPKADEIRAALRTEADEAAESAGPDLDPWAYAEPVPGSEADVPGSEVREPGWSALTAELRSALAVPAAVRPSVPVEPDPVPVAVPPVTRVPEPVAASPAVTVEPVEAGSAWSRWRNRLRSQAGTDTRVRESGAEGTNATRDHRPIVVWPVMLLALPAFVAVWGGWVGLGKLSGFGPMDLLPGFTQSDGDPLVTIDSSITLPIGMETYAAYALYVALSGRGPVRARRFAGWSAAISLGLGALGQIAYHLLVANGYDHAPWQITTAVACVPVAVLGMGFALAHMVRAGEAQ